jgi:peptide-methionine (S)-S-oxide reductase
MGSTTEKATFAGGCFWYTEAIFKKIKGVKKVILVYTGGDRKNPSYEEVSSSVTGHAEAIQIDFDPKVISYKDLLYIFFRIHDPTTLNRQGNDVGTQYRSEIFYHTGEQKKLAKEAIKKLTNLGYYEGDIVTKVSHIRDFYPAEECHHDYYKKNKKKPYCKLVIEPKIKELEENFKDYLK